MVSVLGIYSQKVLCVSPKKKKTKQNIERLSSSIYPTKLYVVYESCVYFPHIHISLNCKGKTKKFFFEKKRKSHIYVWVCVLVYSLS